MTAAEAVRPASWLWTNLWMTGLPDPNLWMTYTLVTTRCWG